MWWDWDAAGDSGADSPEWRHVLRLQAESGQPLDSPETEKLLYRDAKLRIAQNPMLAVKKVLISPAQVLTRRSTASESNETANVPCMYIQATLRMPLGIAIAKKMK